MRKDFVRWFIGGAMFASVAWSAYGAEPTRIVSPDGSMELNVSLGDSICYSVSKDGVTLIDRVSIAMAPEGKPVMGVKPRLTKVSRKSVSDTIRPVVPLKYSAVPNSYNAATMQFAGGYAVEFRVFDDGVAHRFLTSGKGTDNIVSEDYNVTLAGPATAHLQHPGSFKTAYEEPYNHTRLSDWRYIDRMATLPALMERPDGTLLLFSETDLRDYPCMFLKGAPGNSFCATFPKMPVAFGDDGDRSLKILREAPFIASTQGSRAYPWRFVAIGSPETIIEQTLPVRLAGECELEDTSWIKPGTASWEWWNGATPYGEDVTFESGFNMDTYKYFIDFAAKYGIPYIIMDEGWAMDTRDPYTPNPDVNVHEIVRYGKEKGVGVILWFTWLTVENNPDIFKTLSDWGVAGMKIDFMDRSDQWMVNFYERTAREAARHNLLVDFHGAFKPAGLEYRYPNLLSYEGVRGMEQMGGCVPDNSIYLPLMRNAVGAMDYTPGAMISMQPDCYRAERPSAASIGTRSYQLALFVVFESGIQMLADNPTLYYRNPDCTEFITSVPVTWDETRAITAKTGEYLAVAKRKGDTWFIGAIANGAEKHRDLTLPLDFLPEGVNYEMVAFEDGVNSHRQALDYRHRNEKVDASTRLGIRLARNGGFAARLAPVGAN